LHRILDAAANRARESVRVIEDYVRFVLNSSGLTQTLKSLRHRLQSILSELPLEQLIAARDTANDIGTVIEAEGEYRRSSPADVLSANFSRLQESLRCLEEFSKIDTPSLSKQLEQLRYESYTVQKELLHKTLPQKTLSRNNQSGGHKPPDISSIISSDISEAKLYVLLDCRKNEENFIETVNALIDGADDGVDMIQLRDKTADDRTLLARGKLLRQLIDSSDENTAARKPLFIVNDRPDLAVLLNADGIHIGQDELPVVEVRKIINCGIERNKIKRNKIIGVSTHSIEQARKAVADGADYIGIGPVFSSDTKQFTQKQLVGTELLREVAAEKLPIPAFAIGGITLENIDEVLQTGIKRAAVSSAVLNADDPQHIVKSFTERLHIS
jgi:thiamine-phosphate pyrophosphorylase